MPTPAGHLWLSRGLLQDSEDGGDACAQEELEDYNLSLHVGSVFILLGVSLLGSLAPVAIGVLARSPRVGVAIRLGTYFGFGTILSTALIHMLLPGVESLMNECLPPFWIENYEAWPFLFATVAILFMQLVDYLIKIHLRRRGITQHQEPESALPHGGCHAAVIGAIVGSAEDASVKAPPAAQGEPADAEAGQPSEEGGTCPVHGDGCKTLLAHPPDITRTVGIYFTEAGIVFHSVMIGITLGVASGTSFTTLLIALSFHQFFEGFAIGSAAIDAALGAAKCAVLGLVYSVTTPIGIAVGIAIRESFNENSTSALLATGILDSLSAGVLLYVVLVQLVAPMLTDSAWLHAQRWYMQVAAFASFYAGTAAMAVIGKWA